jgi:hypothetical protein
MVNIFDNPQLLACQMSMAVPIQASIYRRAYQATLSSSKYQSGDIPIALHASAYTIDNCLKNA